MPELWREYVEKLWDSSKINPEMSWTSKYKHCELLLSDRDA